MEFRSVRFTRHAKERMRQAGLNFNSAMALLRLATETQLSDNQLMYKFLKYDVKALRTVKYYVKDDIRFTINKSLDNRATIITITNLKGKNVQ